MYWITPESATPEVARRMRETGVVASHAMGLRSDLMPTAQEHDQSMLACLKEIEQIQKRRKTSVV